MALRIRQAPVQQERYVRDPRTGHFVSAQRVRIQQPEMKLDHMDVNGPSPMQGVVSSSYPPSDIKGPSPMQGVVSTSYLPPSGAMCKERSVPDANTVPVPERLRNEINIMLDKSRKRDDRLLAQRKLEEALVEYGRCSNMNPEIVDGLRLRLFTLNDDVLDNAVNDPLNTAADVHSNISCLVDTVIYNGNFGGMAPILRERIRNWFTYLKQIGQPSVEGYAMATSFSDDTSLFVMKSPRDPNSDDLVHEAVIGFYALNNLRKFVPNFMYVYGYTQCSPPVLEDKEPVTWCSSTNPGVSYLITENIRNGQIIGDFAADPSVTWTDLLGTYLQVINALNLAYKRYGYTHYDLHMGNIVVRSFPQKVAIPFYGQNTPDQGPVGWIATSYVPYVIDYGYSRIDIGGVGFGKIGLEGAGIDPSSAFPMFDLYKNLCFVAEAIIRANPEGIVDPTTQYKMDTLQAMFDYFQDGNIQDRVFNRLQPGVRDWYSAPPQFESVTYDDYLTWLSNIPGMDGPIITDMDALHQGGVIVPALDQKIDMCRFFEEISADKPPESALEYCEVVNALRKTENLNPVAQQQATEWLNRNYNAEDDYLRSRPTEMDKLNEFDDIVLQENIFGSDSILPDLTKMKIEDLVNPVNVKNYRLRILKALKLKDISALSMSHYRSTLCSLNDQQVYSKYKEELDQVQSRVTKNYRYISQLRDILRRNDRHVSKLRFKRYTNDRRVISFWEEEHPVLTLAL